MYYIVKQMIILYIIRDKRDMSQTISLYIDISFQAFLARFNRV